MQRPQSVAADISSFQALHKMSTSEDDSVITQEELEELKELISTHDLSSAADTIKHFLEQQDRVELNIAVTGESGSGKSTFINAFRGLEDDDEDSAKTGVVETTKEPKAYKHPKYKNVKLWDLPGIGTPNFKAHEYLKLVQFERYDFFIIIASGRFRECHADLVKEIKRMKKNFYFIRSKTDLSIDAERRKKHFDEKKTLDNIREDCVNGLREIGVEDPVVFLISSWHLNKYDFNSLHERMETELPQHKRHVLMLTVPNITTEIIERKKKSLEKNISRVAFLSAGAAAVPVPGLSVAVDIALLVNEIQKYKTVFGLDDESLKRISERCGKSIEFLMSEVKSIVCEGITTNSIILLLKQSSLYVAEEAVERAVSFIPIIGSLVAAGLSFFTVSYMLKKILNEIAEDAKNVLLASPETELPEHKRHVLMLTVPNNTTETIERKKKALEKNISRVALLSAGAAAVPVPGLSVAVDIALLVNEIQKYKTAFGLDDESLERISERSGKSIELLKSEMKSVACAGITINSIILLLKQSSVLVAESIVEHVVSFIPMIGSAVAAGMSYATVSYMLKEILNEIAEDGKNVLMYIKHEADM
ncbi:interferon-inducible GTPase 5-like isoform X1 [Xyrauchen texanus]|uniref:interferon-inducible GTPase 5-like isoform X1 n=1 Tax=Xyrauchen texanus TaxID=154827 RepID=UPI002242086D|nr:interferon-inducible GTPase 5-like isoform X1 [Xyrauchen texanus]